MIDQVSFKETSFAPSPQRFEAGTPNVAGVIGLGEAIQFLSQFDMKEIHDHENNLLVNAREQLSEIVGFKEYGTTSNKAPVLSLLSNRFIPTIWLLFLMQKVLRLEPVTIVASH